MNLHLFYLREAWLHPLNALSIKLQRVIGLWTPNQTYKHIPYCFSISFLIFWWSIAMQFFVSRKKNMAPREIQQQNRERVNRFDCACERQWLFVAQLVEKLMLFLKAKVWVSFIKRIGMEKKKDERRYQLKLIIMID